MMGNLLLGACMLEGMEEEEGGYARPNHPDSGKHSEISWWRAGPCHFSGSCIANKPGKTHRAQHWDVSICLVHILVCGDLEPLRGAYLGWDGQLRCGFFPQITPLLGSDLSKYSSPDKVWLRQGPASSRNNCAGPGHHRPSLNDPRL